MKEARTLPDPIDTDGGTASLCMPEQPGNVRNLPIVEASAASRLYVAYSVHWLKNFSTTLCAVRHRSWRCWQAPES